MRGQTGGVLPVVAAGCMPCAAAASTAIPSIGAVLGIGTVAGVGVAASKMKKKTGKKKKKKKTLKSQSGGARHKQDWEKNEGYFGKIMDQKGKLNRDEICHNCYPSDYAKSARRFCKVHDKVWDQKTNSCRKKRSSKKQKGGGAHRSKSKVRNFSMNANGNWIRIIQDNKAIKIYSNKQSRKTKKRRKGLMKQIYYEEFDTIQSADKIYNRFFKIVS